MKQVEFWFWQLRKPATDKIERSSCRLTDAEALRRDPPAATRARETCEARMLPKHPDEYLPRVALLNAAQSPRS